MSIDMKNWHLILLACGWSALMVWAGVLLAHAAKIKSREYDAETRERATALRSGLPDPGDDFGRPSYYSICTPCTLGDHHGVVDNPPVFGHQRDDYGYPWRVVCDCDCQGAQRPSLMKTS